ncbi:MAG TPA: outer membrane beta-barrel protein [Bryobacteraceae bacterium]|nr:outer membrane beta-barrel protein [Bryobacteraceae bacterium]
MIGEKTKNSVPWRGILALAAMLLLVMPVFGQTAKSSNAVEEYSTFDLSINGGWQWFPGTKAAKLDSGPIVGARFDYDFASHFGWEVGYIFGRNDVLLTLFPGPIITTFDAHSNQLATNIMVYATRRESRMRPFVTIGPGAVWFDPVSKTVPGPQGSNSVYNLKGRVSPALVYGGGLKIGITSQFGVRFDARGVWTQTPHWNLPDVSMGPLGPYSPRRTTENAWQTTMGIVFRFGGRSEAPAPAPAPTPAPAPPPPPRVTTNLVVDSVRGAHDICQGDSLTLQAVASGWPSDQSPTYSWTLNGEPVGGNSSSLNVPASRSGRQEAVVRVSAGGDTKSSQAVTFNIRPYAPPTVDFTISPSTITRGTKVPLNATARGSDCSGAITITYSADDGTIDGSTFDSTTVSFGAATGRVQTKTVNITATARDEKGGTGSARASVVVTQTPEARRLDDIVFGSGNARVNNCAKRLLLEELTGLLRDNPGSKVILVGHRDSQEKGPGIATLDRRRVLNAVAVLSAGTGICPSLDLSRVQVDWVGTDQASATRPSFCGTSTTVKERKGQEITESDSRAQYRRVEIWFVPAGAAMPSGVRPPKEVPAAEVKKLGCPK